MEVDGYTHMTQAMINLIVAAVVGKTATLAGPIQSIASTATSSELKEIKEREASFLKAPDDHQGIIMKMCRAYCDTRADEEDLFQEIVYQLWRAWWRFRTA